MGPVSESVYWLCLGTGALPRRTCLRTRQAPRQRLRRVPAGEAELDQLNYGLTENVQYVFDPWWCSFTALSTVMPPTCTPTIVDDAVGNIQADGLGFIVDVGSTKNLENQRPAGSANHDQLCAGGAGTGQVHELQPLRSKPQERRQSLLQQLYHQRQRAQQVSDLLLRQQESKQAYTFKITQTPPLQLFLDQSKAHWTVDTSKPIACEGNKNFSPSSGTWCCDKSASNGVFAFTTPEPHNAHNALNHFVIAHGPEVKTTTTDKTCNQ